MKPFLILQLRELDEAADSEFRAFLKYGKLRPQEVHRIRMERESFNGLRPRDFAGIIVGGGPSNVSDEETGKPAYQKRFEAELNELYEEIYTYDLPFFGNCYGLGSFVRFMGGIVGKEKYSEAVGYTTIELQARADQDPLLRGLGPSFLAFVGHKEACQTVPKGGVLLASSAACPVQMIRFKENIYAMQFHCELDAEGIAERIHFYKDYGYFDPKEAAILIEKTKNIVTREAGLILQRFVERYR